MVVVGGGAGYSIVAGQRLRGSCSGCWVGWRNCYSDMTVSENDLGDRDAAPLGFGRRRENLASWGMDFELTDCLRFHPNFE